MCFIGLAFVYDMRFARLPNKLTMFGVLAGLLFHAVNEGWSGLVVAIIGALTGFLVVLILYLLGGLGAGDVKLFAAIGAMMGVLFVLQTLMYAILCAGFIGLIILLWKSQMKVTSHKLVRWLFTIVVQHNLETLVEIKDQKNIKFPFMYAVVPGVAITWYYSLL
ncbi:A24 family peptidase [Paenibacillus pectinilyticus]|nr:A24 family peptidase [Paenibacillus pectinilyticus]